MDNELAIVEESPLEVATTEPRTLQQTIKNNEQLVRSLAPQIQKQHLMSVQGNAYMKVAGGIAIAQTLGFTITVGDVQLIKGDEEHDYYQCTAELLKDGVVVAKAVGYLGMDERTWSNRPTYARRSMCQTRAQAKLCRANFGALYTLMGATHDTPAEEMDGVTVNGGAHPAGNGSLASSNSGTSGGNSRSKSSAQTTHYGGLGVPKVQNADGSKNFNTGVYEIAAVEEEVNAKTGQPIEGTTKNGKPWKKWRIIMKTGEWFSGFQKDMSFNGQGIDPEEMRQAIQHNQKVHVLSVKHSKYGTQVEDVERVSDNVVVNQDDVLDNPIDKSFGKNIIDGIADEEIPF